MAARRARFSIRTFNPKSHNAITDRPAVADLMREVVEEAVMGEPVSAGNSLITRKYREILPALLGLD